MNTVIFGTYQERRPWSVALCQGGVPHGPFVKVALIPPGCPGCEPKATPKKRREFPHTL